jgi:hypothetical protein
MVPIDSEPSPSDRPITVTNENTAPSAATSGTVPPGGIWQLLAFVLIAAILAGVGSLLVGEGIVSRYRSGLVPAIKAHPGPDDIRQLREARLYSATLTFGAMGGLLGLAMGMAGGLARRSVLASAWAGIVGLLLGTAAVASLSMLLVSNFYKRYDPQGGDLVLPLLTHGAAWSVVGAIGGLAFGLGLGGKGRWKATLVGGLVGAAAATVIYEFVGALAFASSKADLPLSESMVTRGMAQLLIAILAAVGAGVAAHQVLQTESPSSLPS